MQSICFSLQVSAGEVLYVHSLATGQRVAKVQHKALSCGQRWEEGVTTAPLHVEGSRDGRLVYVAGADGAIQAIDLRCIFWPSHATNACNADNQGNERHVAQHSRLLFYPLNLTTQGMFARGVMHLFFQPMSAS